MNVFVADPHWGWWITCYFFLGGIAAGCYFVATLVTLFGQEEDRTVSRLGYSLAFPLVAVCGVSLILDLDHPSRFWHMLLRSEVVNQAFGEGWPWTAHSWRLMASAPLLKHWSPMSIGSWALLVFGLCSSLSFLGSLWPGGRLERILLRGFCGRVLQGIGCFVGFFVASYTGVLLTATNQPLWCDTTWIAPLFLTSAASTGLAALILLGSPSRLSGAARRRLEEADHRILYLKLLVFLGFLASIGSLLKPLFGTTHGVLVLVSPLLFGVLLPLGLRHRSPRWAASFALVGGFLLRYAILATPPELLARAAADPATTPGPGGSWFSGDQPGPSYPRLSPEDGRQPGGGPGADPGNRSTDFQPRSKVFHDR